MFRIITVNFFWLVATLSMAQTTPLVDGARLPLERLPPALSSIRYLVPSNENSPTQVRSALLRAKDLLNEGLVGDGEPPIVFVLHGPEAAIFLKENYEKYREIVDLAAQLTAFNVVDVRVCQNRLGELGSRRADLVPFVGTVPNGGIEIKRLIEKEAYIYF